MDEFWEQMGPEWQADEQDDAFFQDINFDLDGGTPGFATEQGGAPSTSYEVPAPTTPKIVEEEEEQVAQSTSVDNTSDNSFDDSSNISFDDFINGSAPVNTNPTQYAQFAPADNFNRFSFLPTGNTNQGGIGFQEFDYFSSDQFSRANSSSNDPLAFEPCTQINFNQQPRPAPAPAAPKQVPAGNIPAELVKDTLARISGSLAMNLLRASLDGPTRLTSQRQLLYALSMFDVDGTTQAEIPPVVRKSLEGIWNLFNKSESYQRMILMFVVEKLLAQNPPLREPLISENENLEAKINSLQADDPELLTKAVSALLEEVSHRGHVLEASKVLNQNAIKQLELRHQQALAAKQAETDLAKSQAHQAKSQVNQSFKRMQQMQAETKKMKENMKVMYTKVQQLTASMSSMNLQLTEANQRCSVAHGMNSHLMQFATPEQMAAAAAASNAPSPSDTVDSSYQTPIFFDPNRSVTPTPAQAYFFSGQSITPPPSKKRKASATPFVGQFYQCRAFYTVDKATKETAFCGVINNQFMAGGKNDGQHRQRCVNKDCKKYTDIKDKHWVEDWVVEMYGVGKSQAPFETPKLGQSSAPPPRFMLESTPVPTPAATADEPTPTPTPEQADEPGFEPELVQAYSAQAARLEFGIEI